MINLDLRPLGSLGFVFSLWNVVMDLIDRQRAINLRFAQKKALSARNPLKSERITTLGSLSAVYG